MNDGTALGNKRRIYAPIFCFGNSTTSGPIYVELNDNEDVIWTYQHDFNGNKFVSGYTIIKKN